VDLLACTSCGDRFYVMGVGFSDTRGCPHCGGGLSHSLYDTASIPLDARWIDSDRYSDAEAPTLATKLVQLNLGAS
jgi:predicted  nucleic acid-binding Zn-ribbon protein